MESLFFAFPDGVFHYVCAECDALCCKGQGFGGNVHREMGFLLETYPTLSAVVTARSHEHVSVATPRGRCFFLQTDNLCQIEVEHGRFRKPGVCMAFPFNRFLRIGDWVVVMPHFICPLRLDVPARAGSVAGTHATIESTLRETQMLTPGYISERASPIKGFPVPNADAIIQQQKRFRDLCSAALGTKRFRHVVREESKEANALSEFSDRAMELMRWESSNLPSNRDYLDDILLALAPSLSIEMAAFEPERIRRVLLLSEAVVRSVFGFAPQTATPQQVHSIIQQSMPILSLLSLADEAAATVDPIEAPMLGTPELVLAAGQILEDSKSTSLLDALEKAFSIVPTASDRTIVAHYVARHLAESN